MALLLCILGTRLRCPNFRLNFTKMQEISMYTVHPTIAYANAIIQNLSKTTGKSLEQWIALVKQSGVSTIAEQRVWLKKNYDLGATTAGLIAEYTAGKGVETDEDYLRAAEIYVGKMYSGPKELLRPLHDTLLEHALSLGDDVKVSPCKTIVPLYRTHVFAQIKPTTHTRIDLGLALRQMPDIQSSRVVPTGGLVKGDRLTHRIAIQSLTDIDDEVMLWLRKAYELDKRPV